MSKEKRIKHVRKLNFRSFENNQEDSIWSLFWYGKISYRPSESRFYINVYLTLMKKDDYFLTNINKRRVEKIEIPFSKSILFPLSSQFDYEGNFLRMSNVYDKKGDLLKNGLYIRSKIKISNQFNFKTSGLENHFVDSLFPEVFDQDVSIYRKAPYFYRKNEYSSNNSNEVCEYIIPIDVILRYFFGYSSLLLDLLITDRLKRAIFDISFDKENKRGRLHYDSNLISRTDVDSIAKYFFTKDDIAYKMISNIGAYFSTIRLNNQKQTSFVKFKLPFDFPCDFQFVGQFFKNIEGTPRVKKIIVNQILEVLSMEDFFLAKEGIDIIDINPSKETHQALTEAGTGTGNVRHTGETNPVKDEETDNLPLNQNNSDRIINTPIELRNCFGQSPGINHLVKIKDNSGEYVYVKDERLDNHSDFPDFEGRRRRKTENYTNINWIDIFYGVIEYLIQKFGYEANCLLDRQTEKNIGNRIIYELKYKKVSYYIVESTIKNYLPIFRNKDRNDTIDIDAIIEIINVIDNKCKSNWQLVSNKKSLKEIDKFKGMEFLEKNDVLFLRNSTHEERPAGENDENWEKTIENQAKKIHTKIQNDLKGLSEN